MCVDNDVFDCRLIKDDYPSSLRLIQTGLHEHHHHHVDVYCKPDDSHHGDQDNQDVDQIDDKDPLLIEDAVDDDDDNDNHHAIDLQNDDDTCHNDDVN